ncbi:hypothetical protein GLYMA_08G061432v4 [Glycine max]|nr:hypothetical protein GLYMA_08G061432v4 [Glycine max]KAH1049887.1 hypothetical protein GYH30_020403 [Glycine max]
MSREELFLWLPVKDIIVTDPSSASPCLGLKILQFVDPIQVLCSRLVEGRVLDLQLRDERLFAWLRMASLLFLVSLFWVRLFPRENYVKRCAKPKYIMSSINCMKLIIREKIIPLPVN